MTTKGGIFLAAALVGLVVCGCQQIGNRGRTILSNDESVESLNAKANDASLSQDVRARAIYSLFAHHIRPGATSAEVHQIITNANWINETHFAVQGVLFGWVPVHWGINDTLIVVHLFQDPKTPWVHFPAPDAPEIKWSPWCIYMVFSAPRPGTYDAKVGAAFLRGEPAGASTRLLEFGLCFPPGEQYRTETFIRRGITVNEY